MRKIWIIAQREYLYNFRRRSYLFTAFGVPLFSIVMIFVISALVQSTVTATGTLGNIGYVDNSGILVDPVDKPEEYSAFDSESAANAAYLDGEIGAYFVIDANYMGNGQVDAYSRDSIPEGIQDQLGDFLRANVARLAPENISVDRLVQPFEVKTVFLDTGEVVEDETGFMMLFFKPYIFVLVFVMATFTTSQFLMSGVVEEKENRMMEILVTSSTSLEMLWGKVLGLGALGLTQIILWVVGGAVLLNVASGMDAGPGSFLSALTQINFTAADLVVGLVFFFLGYFLYAGVMAGIGAAMTSEREAQQVAGIFSMVVVLPMILSFSFIDNPNGGLPLFLSLFPLTASVSMVVRMPLSPVPLWQLVLSGVLLVLAVVVVMWLSARVFRLGMLMYGKRLTVPEIWRALRQGRRTITSVAHAEEV